MNKVYRQGAAPAVVFRAAAPVPEDGGDGTFDARILAATPALAATGTSAVPPPVPPEPMPGAPRHSGSFITRALIGLFRPAASRLRRFFFAGLQHELARTHAEVETLKAAQASILADLDASRTQLAGDVHHTQSALLKAVRHTDRTAVQRSINAYRSLRDDIEAVGREVDRRLSDVAATMTSQTDESRRRIESALTGREARIDRLVPDLLSSAVAAPLGAVELGQRVLTAEVQQLRAALEALAPRVEQERTGGAIQAQLDRIESYALAAARRVAIPCDAGRVMVRTDLGYVLCAASDYALLAALVEQGGMEEGTRQVIERILSPGHVFIDVGANVGLHTLAARRRVGPQGRVVAIEPFDETASLLEQTLWINGCGDVVLHRVALADADGRALLHRGRTSGHHSLLRPDAASDADAVDVRVTTLDALAGSLPMVTLVKVDVEGFELRVLAGGRTVFATHPLAALIVEYGASHLARTGCTPADWRQALAALGMVCRSIDDKTGQTAEFQFDGPAPESVNLLCARRESPVWNRI